ncbi:MAG TPA: aldehyde dehydrogenase family protein [Iamia sp.]
MTAVETAADVRHGLLIGGSVVAGSGEPIPLVSRRDGSSLGVLDGASPSDVAAAYAAASSAQPGWAAFGPSARADVLNRAAVLFRERSADMGETISHEMGKPLGEARTEVAKGAASLEYHAQAGFRSLGSTYVTDTGEDVFTVAEPLGVVCLITPWNFPFTLPIKKIAAALATGNAAVFKPAPNAVLCALAIGQTLLDAGLPPGVLNVVLGDTTVIEEALLTDPALAGVSFTGSFPTAQTIHRRLSVEVPLQAELGGKNALVVWRDADVDVAADVVAQSSFRNNGQICTSAGRVLVHEDVADALLAALRALVDARPATTADGDHGVMSSEGQHRAVADAVARHPGEVVRSPWSEELMAPTLLVAPPAGELTEEEIFGPVVTVETVADLDEAVTAANATSYGLTAGIVTSDLGVAHAFWRRSTAGTVKVNAPLTGTPYHVPIQGFGRSGAGAGEGGEVGIEFFTRRKAVHIRRPAAT